MSSFLTLTLTCVLVSCVSISNDKEKLINHSVIKEKDLSGSEESPFRVLSDRPLCAETKMHELDEAVTPTHKMFVRNNGITPEIAYSKDFSSWSLLVDGEVERKKTFSLEELKSIFPHYEYQLTLECGGNGRAGFYPKAKGYQWTYGAVASPLWKGIRVKDLLAYVGLKDSAVYLAYEALDLHPSGDSDLPVISRGVPIAKALHPMTLLAFELNGVPLPPEHGAPLRLVCPGYPASASGKWLKRLWIRDRVHDGAKMEGDSYRLPPYPVAPGTIVGIDDTWKILEKMPVKSIITYPKSGGEISYEEKDFFSVRGFAWTGEEKIESVHVSFDFGVTWHKTKLEKPRNSFSWQRWSATFSLPSQGYFEIWAKAKDSAGKEQPMIVPSWNPKGYANNAMPRISITVKEPSSL